MESFLIEIIAERALQSNECVKLVLKDIKGLKAKTINGKVIQLTEKYMILSVDDRLERPIFLEWIDFIEVMGCSE